MADRKRSYVENVPGPFYVDDNCIDCDMCLATAPNNFERNPLGRYSFVSKQPVNDEEWALCQQAMEECPVGAIGCEGTVG